MRLRLLLVNPWICDFAAANLWSQPLGLYRVAECLNKYDVAFSLIDCMDEYLPKQFGSGQYRKELIEKPACLRAVPRRYGRYGISIDEFRQRLKDNGPFDAVLVTSVMSYWYPGVQQAITLIRESCGRIPVILGGIYATLWHQHASENSGADFIYRGQVSDNISFVFNTFGFRLKQRKKPDDRSSLKEFYSGYTFAPILTGTGCPFSCSYCGSNQLNRRFLQRPVQDVIDEILDHACRGITDFAFYDDALLVNADFHIRPILKEIIRKDLNIRFHCPNGLHARFIDDELAYLMKQAGFETLRLSLETVDTDRQQSTGSKVSTSDLLNAVSVLSKHGFRKENIGVYLMYGLPGQSLDEVKEGISFLKSLDVRINLTEFSPVPGTSCWDELVRQNIIADNIDPLLTNNSVFSYLYSGYDPDEVNKIRLAVTKFNHNK